ncbi:putative serine/threonine protein kinase [Blattamonas nauphoetae]|uniref:non-specific serine/threonine protein kinase n=1 Tax=Blattamonas nauphoetae TaxID=2049346 RepID=A0ABQ9WWX5_9EUKA|nr:putative serine/threonine protein kinase [Blattamonas nauphoetae]
MESLLARQRPEDIFTLDDSIGEGTYATVYKALDKTTHKHVALKKVEFDDEDTLMAIVKEIQVMKACTHPNVVGYFNTYLASEGTLLISMELCESGSLASILKSLKHGLSEEQVSFVLYESLKGLAHLHKNKVIHRDIKAGNILITSKGEVKLADFGVSANLEATMNKRNTSIGTPFWMAPEVIQQEGYSFEADIWSLGITAIELIEMKPPLSSIHPMRALFQIPSNLPPELKEKEKFSSEMNDFIATCLTKDHTKRPLCDVLLKHPLMIKASKLPKDYLVFLLREVEKGPVSGMNTPTHNSLQSDDLLRKPELKRYVRKTEKKEEPKPAEESDEEEYGTMVVKDKKKDQDQNESDEEEYGTMVVKKEKPKAKKEESSDDGDYGTMVVKKPKTDQKEDDAEEEEWEEYSEYED